MRWNRGFAVATLGVLVLGSFACSKAEQEARNEIRKRAVGTWTCNTDSDSYHEGPFEITVDPGGTFDVHRTNAGDLDATPTDRSGSWKVDDDGTLTVSGEEFLYQYRVPSVEDGPLESRTVDAERRIAPDDYQSVQLEVDIADEDHVSFRIPDDPRGTSDTWECERL